MESKRYFQIQIALSKFSQSLRTLFLQKYESKTSQKWVDNNISGNQFIIGLGSKIYKKFKKIQQVKLSNGNTNEWDIPMFSEIFNTMFYEKQLSQNLAQIIKIRNNIAHNSSISISEPKFKDYWTSLLLVSKYFKIDEKVMSDIQNEKIVTSQEDDQILEKPNREFAALKEEANTFFNKKNYKKANEIYSKAIALPEITSKDRAVLFSNRSCSYLNLYTSVKDSLFLMQSISDAKQAITFWPYWPKGYIRLGDAYEAKNKWKKALIIYEKALELDPMNKMVEDHISSLKIEYMKKNVESINPNSFLSSFEEEQEKLQNYLKKSTGLSLSETEMNRLIKSHVSEDIYKAFECMHGFKNSKPNLEQANQYFAKAAHKGNAEGMYNLALGFIEGAGINKDPQAGFALLEKAANMAPFDKDDIPVIGVAESQFALGDYYENGIYVNKDIKNALYWYQKSNENGHKTAANNLGVIYYKGNGVKIDFKKAENFFLLAHSRKEPLAEYNLIEVYISLCDPNQAIIWHERALKNNNLLAIKQDKNIRSRIEELKQFKKVPEFENKWENIMNQTNLNLNSEPPSPSNHLMREFNYYTELMINNLEMPNDLIDIYYKKSKGSIDKLCFFDMFRSFNPKMLESFKQEGSITAELMLKAGNHFLKTLDYLYGDKCLTDIDFIDNLAKACAIYPSICAYHFEQIPRITKIIDNVLKKCGKSNSSVDENARIAYIFYDYNRKNILEFVQKSLQKYPSNTTLKYLGATRLLEFKKIDESLELFESLATEKLDSTKIDIIFRIAKIQKEKNIMEKAINNMLLFANKAHKDHESVPEAYYTLGGLYSNDVNEGMKYYKLGLEAETYQLPIFLPYKSKEKEKLAKLFKNKKKLQGSIIPKEDVEKAKVKLEMIDPMRLELFVTYRKTFFDLASKIKSNNIKTIQFSAPFSQNNEKLSLIGLKPIYFKEMDMSQDNENKGCVLTGVIMDEILTGVFPSVHMILEDEKKNVLRACLYNLGSNYLSIQNIFQIGSILQIINPFLRVGVDGKPFIRVENQKNVIVIDKKEKICRFCGKENSIILCIACKNARYCSTQCQTKDLKILRHDYICEKNSNRYNNKKQLMHKKWLIAFIPFIAIILYYMLIWSV